MDKPFWLLPILFIQGVAVRGDHGFFFCFLFFAFSLEKSHEKSSVNKV
jgi:short subunit fatty acids transporter